MSENISNRIIAISMVFLLLFSSTGFSIDKHFCQGELKDISFFGSAHCCSEMQLSTPCHDKKKNQKCTNHHENEGLFLTGNCCHNEHLSILGLDGGINIKALITSQNIDLVIISINHTILKLSIKDDLEAFASYLPPTSNKDFQILYQTFLI